MDEQWIYPSRSQADTAEQLDARQRAQDALWVQLRGEEDPERRMALLAEFSENRAAIDRLSESLASGPYAADGAGDGDIVYRVEVEPEIGPRHDRRSAPDRNGSGSGPLTFDESGELVVSPETSGSVEPHGADEERQDADLVEQGLAGPGFDEPGFGEPGFDKPGEGAAALDAYGFAGLADEFGLDGLVDQSESAGPERAARPAPDGHDPDIDSPRPFAGPGTLADWASSASSNGNGHGHVDRDLADGRSDPSLDTDADPGLDTDAGSDPELELDLDFDQEDEPSASFRPRPRVTAPGGGRVSEPGPRAPGPRQPGPRSQGPRGPAPREGRPHGADAEPGTRRSGGRGAAAADATSQFPAARGPRPGPRGAADPADKKNADSPSRLLILLGGLVAVLALSWFVIARGSDDTPTSVASDVTASTDVADPAGPSADADLDEILAAVRGLGFETVGADRRGSAIHLTGMVPTSADRDRVIGVVQAVVADGTVDATELRSQDATTAPAGPVDPASSNRAAALQAELRRVVAATPIIFAVEETAITDLHARILNSVVSTLLAYPDVRVKIVGFTDDTGSAESNTQISLRRAESVQAYLVGQGVPEDMLSIEAQGETTSTGAQALANLERRVEFEVEQTEGSVAAPATELLRVAIVAPSARNDLAFTQSMVDAVNALAAERGNVELAITDNTFVPEEAATALRSYATDDYDLVIAHGSQYGSALFEIAQEHPDVAFAWGTASDTFGLPNVYAYDAAAQQGGYVLGSMSTLLSATGVVGVVGPIEVGDAELYVNGFQAGARASKPDAGVLVTYTGSFSDLALAADAARSQTEQGADVMTGSAQMVVGAVSVATENNALWFGTQANQTSLAPSLVVASQVYHWEVILRQIVADLDRGTLGGATYTADLANGGLVIEYNPDYPLPESVRQRADEVTLSIINGTLEVPR